MITRRIVLFGKAPPLCNVLGIHHPGVHPVPPHSHQMVSATTCVLSPVTARRMRRE